MRLQSNHAQGPFQQLRLVMRGLSCRLYVLYYRIGGTKSKLEVSQTTPLPITYSQKNSSQLAIDKQHLRITDSESATRTAAPSPTAGMHLLYYIFQR